MFRWIHSVGRSDVLEGNCRSWSRGSGIAAIYDNRLRDQRSKGGAGDGYLPEALAKL